MVFSGDIALPRILRHFWRPIGVTWALVVVENVLITLIPLLIGFTIDGLLAGRVSELFMLAGVLAALIVIAVIRRIFDTRAYGSIRVALGTTLHRRFPDMEVSAKTARIDMCRELVDFMEEEVPVLLTAVIQIVITLGVLFFFDFRLAASALIATVAMGVLYMFFHRRFYRLNGALNQQKEAQVRILGDRRGRGVIAHLRAMRRHEVRLSDTEAIVYGLIFLLQIGFIIYNLWLGASLPAITAGTIFAIVTYSWEYVEAAVMLPAGLQSWSRLAEITGRINRPG